MLPCKHGPHALSFIAYFWKNNLGREKYFARKNHRTGTMRNSDCSSSERRRERRLAWKAAVHQLLPGARLRGLRSMRLGLLSFQEKSQLWGLVQDSQIFICWLTMPNPLEDSGLTVICALGGDRLFYFQLSSPGAALDDEQEGSRAWSRRDPGFRPL